MRDFWDTPGPRRFLVIGALLYMIGATSWSMPAGFPLKTAIDPLFAPVFRRLGLWQGWDMFAPTPRDEDIFLTAEIEFIDGTNTVDVLSRMSEMSYGERYIKERWRKFMNDNLRLDSNKAMWNEAGAWIARRASVRDGKPVRKVDLYRHWRACARPEENVNVLDDRRPFNKFKFYSFGAVPQNAGSSNDPAPPPSRYCPPT